MALPKHKTRLAGRVRVHRQRSKGWQANYSALYGSPKSSALPKNWRDRLPLPDAYYSAHVVKLGKPNALGWAQGLCPFHTDSNASLGVNLIDPRGGWRCFAGCGGGDLCGFHMKLTGMDFKEAVADLLRMAR